MPCALKDVHREPVWTRAKSSLVSKARLVPHVGVERTRGSQVFIESRLAERRPVRIQALNVALSPQLVIPVGNTASRPPQHLLVNHPCPRFECLSSPAPRMPDG